MDTEEPKPELVIPGPESGRRRRFTTEEKRRFLNEASRPGETISSVGRRYGLSVSLLFRWRRQLQGYGARRTANRAGSDMQQEELVHLHHRVHELQRMLGEKTAENEELRRRLRVLETPAGALGGASTVRDGRA